MHNHNGVLNTHTLPKLIHHIGIIPLVYWSTIICANGQSSVGNGSSIAPAAGQQGNFGINSPTQGGVEYRTRHFRRRDNTGIGSSFIGTTSPTSEGSPALRPTSPATMRTSAMRFRLPKLESIFPEANVNPALDSFSPALPQLPEGNVLTSPAINVSSFGHEYSSSDLETTPYSKSTPSLTDKLQFNSFDSFSNSYK